VTLGLKSAAIVYAKRQGLDTVILRGMGESSGRDQIAVLNPANIQSAITGKQMGRGVPSNLFAAGLSVDDPDLDILAQSASQGATQGYEEQAQSYLNMSAADWHGGIGWEKSRHGRPDRGAASSLLRASRRCSPAAWVVEAAVLSPAALVQAASTAARLKDNAVPVTSSITEKVGPAALLLWLRDGGDGAVSFALIVVLHQWLGLVTASHTRHGATFYTWKPFGCTVVWGSVAMAELKDEIAAYEAMKGDLESSHLGKFALVHDRTLVGTYDTFDMAAQVAVHRFGRGPYLIRQIGAPPITLPASVMYHPVYGKDAMRIRW
jgi:hypothetical protein